MYLITLAIFSRIYHIYFFFIFCSC